MTVSVFIKGRMYDYNNGRFLSVDPFIQAPTSTQSMNPYTYIFNNPLSGIDPTGYLVEDKKVKTSSVAPIGSNIRSSKRFSGGSGDQAFSLTVDKNGAIVSSNNLDVLTSLGAETKPGNANSGGGNNGNGGIESTGGQNLLAQNDNNSSQQSAACKYLGNHPSCKSSGTKEAFDDVVGGIDATAEVLDAYTDPDITTLAGPLTPFIKGKKAINATDKLKDTRKASKVTDELRDSAKRLGIDINDINIVDGVARTQIKVTASLKPRDIDALKTYLKSQGANKLQIESGLLANEKLNDLFEHLIIHNKKFKGGTVRPSAVDGSDYTIIFDL